MRAAFRRVPEKTSDVIESGLFIVDTTAHNAELNGQKLKLTPKVFELLVCLLRHPDHVLTHAFLLRSVWGDYYSEQHEALRVLVGSLRKKIETDPSSPKYLLTEPWIGYRFHPETK
jgi:two-component system KDP operon response regulator KdpE